MPRAGGAAACGRRRRACASRRRRCASATPSTQSHDLVFGAVVGCILLIACANLANLVLVRTLHQQRELAIRAALGGAPGRVGGHLLRQHLLLVLFGGALGVVLAQGSLGALQSASVLDSLRPPGMEYRLDMRRSPSRSPSRRSPRPSWGSFRPAWWRASIRSDSCATPPRGRAPRGGGADCNSSS